MKIILRILFFSICTVLLWSCGSKQKPQIAQAEKRTVIEMLTNFGPIYLELYNETPQHRDNFIKIIEDGVLDSVLFHRVIQDFMIQGGDPDSKQAPDSVSLGEGGLNYRVFPEFHPNLFHKKGALAAARDNNPDRASSSTQFYIVQGKVFTDSMLTLAEQRINDWLAQDLVKKDSVNHELSEAFYLAMRNNDIENYTRLNDSIVALAKNYEFEHYTIPDEQRQVYKTLGGTPHLDQNYTVFGEVIQGLNVVDSIAAVETGDFDRPVKNVRILHIRVLE
ncbi:peptidylprolyl isomerase [uncultured Draconibacterium sp.]|uniref:peptidylprolyl isomerase n=1 Tax=uncultured Draconibacterium sp. TaxID=1573823 RepID=UPI0032168C24